MSLSLSNLLPNNTHSFLSSSFFQSLVFSHSYILAPCSFLPTLPWTASRFLLTTFPLVHHTLTACSRIRRARNSHTNLPCPTSIWPLTQLIHSVLPAHSLSFSLIHLYIPSHLLIQLTPRYLNAITSSICSPLIDHLSSLFTPTTIVYIV